jgi:hypothetical protein
MTDELNNMQSIEEKIEFVLERLRPFLQRDGGDIKLDHYDDDTGTCYVQMLGACDGCIEASTDVSDSVAVLLMDEIPEIKDVQLVKSEYQESFEDLLRRLREEEQANKELEEYNRTHKDTKFSE